MISVRFCLRVIRKSNFSAACCAIVITLWNAVCSYTCAGYQQVRLSTCTATINTYLATLDQPSDCCVLHGLLVKGFYLLHLLSMALRSGRSLSFAEGAVPQSPPTPFGHLVTLMWSSSLCPPAINTLDKVSKLGDRLEAVLPNKIRPCVGEALLHSMPFLCQSQKILTYKDKWYAIAGNTPNPDPKSLAQNRINVQYRRLVCSYSSFVGHRHPIGRWAVHGQDPTEIDYPRGCGFRSCLKADWRFKLGFKRSWRAEEVQSLVFMRKKEHMRTYCLFMAWDISCNSLYIHDGTKRHRVTSKVLNLR